MNYEANLENSILIISDTHGVYIPQRFAESFEFEELGLSEAFRSDYEALVAGPDFEWYWNAWDAILDNAVISDPNDKKYRLHQDGELWAIPAEEP